MIPGNANPLLLASAAADAGAAGPIKSVRFNSADSAYLNRTPSSAGNRRTFTFAFWIKKVYTSSAKRIFNCGPYTAGTGYRSFNITSNGGTPDPFYMWDYSSSYKINLVADAAHRDDSAWYHLVWAVDTTQATESDRVKLYINGTQFTDWQTAGAGAVYPAQNYETGLGLAEEMRIGTRESKTSEFLDGYLADFYYIDGSALDATSFGAFDDNGVWQAAAYSGTFGTNGFHLFDFANESGIGDDSSGNDNDWTVNNLSSTEVSSITNPTWYAASSYYSDVADVIANGTNKGSGAWTASSEFVYLVVNDGGTPGSNNVSAGNMPILWVMYRNTGGTLTRQGSFGATEFPSFDWSDSTGTYTIANSADYYLFSDEDANPPTNGAFSGSIPALTTASFRTANDINKNLDVLRDVPTNGDASDDTGAGGEVSGNYATLNPLDRKSTVSLSNGNLDATTSTTGWAGVKGTMGVSSGKYYFEATANGSAANKVFFGICASSVKPDTSGYLQDDTTERAKGMLIFCDNGQYQLDGNSRVSYSSSMADGDVIAVAYDLDGNTVQFYKNGSALGSIDISSSPLASTTVVPLYIHYNTNTTYHLNFGQRAFAHSAPSGYKALCTTNLPAATVPDGSDYFDVKTWSGTGAENTLTGFEFSPDMIWVKRRDNGTDWHNITDTVRGATNTLYPNDQYVDTVASQNVKAFTSDGVTLGTFGGVNASGGTYVGWTWDAGANSSKTFTVKVVSDSGNKYRFDDFGTSAVTLDLEEGSTYVFDQSDSSNSGHPLRFSTTSDGTHGSGTEYTTGVTTTGTPGSAGAKTTIVVAASAPTLYYYCSVHSGMGGQANTNSTAGASNFDGSIQTTVRASQTAGMSIVSYTGTGANASIGHGLNAAPEFAIFKARNGTNHWLVYHKSIGNDKKVNLNLSDAQSSSSTSFFQSTDPTSSVMYLGTESSGNWSGYNMIGYLFSSVAGYSAFGTYEGNGSADDGPHVFLDFAPAFLLVKRTDSTGNWILVDQTRGEDKAVYPNQSISESSASFTWVDFVSNGFKIRSSITAVNGSGGDYIYWAIAENPFSSNGGLAR